MMDTPNLVPSRPKTGTGQEILNANGGSRPRTRPTSGYTNPPCLTNTIRSITDGSKSPGTLKALEHLVPIKPDAPAPVRSMPRPEFGGTPCPPIGQRLYLPDSKKNLRKGRKLKVMKGKGKKNSQHLESSSLAGNSVLGGGMTLESMSTAALLLRRKGDPRELQVEAGVLRARALRAERDLAAAARDLAAALAQTAVVRQRLTREANDARERAVMALNALRSAEAHAQGTEAALRAAREQAAAGAAELAAQEARHRRAQGAMRDLAVREVRAAHAALDRERSAAAERARGEVLGYCQRYLVENQLLRERAAELEEELEDAQEATADLKRAVDAAAAAAAAGGGGTPAANGKKKKAGGGSAGEVARRIQARMDAQERRRSGLAVGLLRAQAREQELLLRLAAAEAERDRYRTLQESAEEQLQEAAMRGAAELIPGSWAEEMDAGAAAAQRGLTARPSTKGPPARGGGGGGGGGGGAGKGGRRRRGDSAAGEAEGGAAAPLRVGGAPRPSVPAPPPPPPQPRPGSPEALLAFDSALGRQHSSELPEEVEEMWNKLSVEGSQELGTPPPAPAVIPKGGLGAALAKMLGLPTTAKDHELVGEVTRLLQASGAPVLALGDGGLDPALHAKLLKQSKALTKRARQGAAAALGGSRAAGSKKKAGKAKSAAAASPEREAAIGAPPAAMMSPVLEAPTREEQESFATFADGSPASAELGEPLGAGGFPAAAAGAGGGGGGARGAAAAAAASASSSRRASWVRRRSSPPFAEKPSSADPGLGRPAMFRTVKFGPHSVMVSLYLHDPPDEATGAVFTVGVNDPRAEDESAWLRLTEAHLEAALAGPGPEVYTLPARNARLQREVFDRIHVEWVDYTKRGALDSSRGGKAMAGVQSQSSLKALARQNQGASAGDGGREPSRMNASGGGGGGGAGRHTAAMSVTLHCRLRGEGEVVASSLLQDAERLGVEGADDPRIVLDKQLTAPELQIQVSASEESSRAGSQTNTLQSR